MAADERWYFTKEELQNTYSRKCGIDADKELSYRQQAANFIQDMGQRLPVNQLCINTAIVYMHRFYMYHSFTKFHRNAIATCALFLAAKVEEQPRKLEHVIKVGHMCLARDGPPLDTKSEAYLQQAQQLVMNENIMLQTLGFDVAIDHPHTHIVKCCHLVRASKDLAQTSYIMATTSLHLTTMCLQYKPTVVACVCIHLACKWANWEIPWSSEGKEWFWYVDKTVTLDLLRELTAEFLAILDKCPSRLKKKILSASTGKEGASSEKKLKPEMLSSSNILSGFPSSSYNDKTGSPSVSGKHERQEWTDKQDKVITKSEKVDKTAGSVISEKMDGLERIEKADRLVETLEKQERTYEGSVKHIRPEMKPSGSSQVDLNAHSNKHHSHLADLQRHGSSSQMHLESKALKTDSLIATSSPPLKKQRQDQFAIGKETKSELSSPIVANKRPGKSRHRKEMSSNHTVEAPSCSRVPQGHPTEKPPPSPEKPSVKPEMRIGPELQPQLQSHLQPQSQLHVQPQHQSQPKHVNSDLRKLRLVVSEAAARSIPPRLPKEKIPSNNHPITEEAIVKEQPQPPKSNIFSDMAMPIASGNFAPPVNPVPEKRHEKREKHKHRDKTKDATVSEYKDSVSVVTSEASNPRIKLTIAKERLESNGGVAKVSPKDKGIKLKLSKEMFSSHQESVPGDIPKLKIKIPKNKLTTDPPLNAKGSESRKRNASPLVDQASLLPSPKNARMETRLSRKDDSFPNAPQVDVMSERSKNSRHKSRATMGSKRKSAPNNVHGMPDARALYYQSLATGIHPTHNRQFIGVLPPVPTSSSGIPPLPRDPPPPTPPPPPE